MKKKLPGENLGYRLIKNEYQEQGMVVNQLSSMQELQRSLRKLLAGGLKTNEVQYLCSEHQ